MVDPLLENQSLVGATEGMGLGGITRNSINGLKGKAARSSEDQFQDQDINYDGSSGPDTHSCRYYRRRRQVKCVTIVGE